MPAINYFKLNGTTVAPPERFTGEANDIDSDNTTRLENAVMFRKFIRRGVRKIPVRWPSVSDAEAATICGILEDATGDGFLTVTYKDPLHGVTTKTFYCSSYSWEQKSTSKWSISTTFIEK